MKFFTFIMCLLFSLQTFSQSREELIEEFMKERKKMMESMMDLFNESFEDDFFDTTDPFSDFQSFKGMGSNVSIEEKYEKDGSISIIIKPQNKNVNLDIQTTEDRITIKSEIREEISNEAGSDKVQTMTRSSFSKSIGIPNGYTAKSPEAVGDAIKISLVPSDKVKTIMDKKPQKQDPDMI